MWRGRRCVGWGWGLGCWMMGVSIGAEWREEEEEDRGIRLGWLDCDDSAVVVNWFMSSGSMSGEYKSGIVRLLMGEDRALDGL